VAQNLVRTKLPTIDPERAEGGRKLDLKVIFTDLPRTAAALATARAMARGLGARITVLMAQVVPYPLPLASPPIPVEFTRRQIESVAAGENTTVEILLCRDRLQTIQQALPPDSLVIVGTRKWLWWPSWERKLARALRHDGRRVLVIAQ
jgi:hypothetical protein